MRETVWTVANLGIAGGYYVLALSLVKLLQQFMRVKWPMAVGAGLFFATCSMTHLEHVYHVLYTPNATNASSLLANHSLVIHAVQVVAVWLFIFGTLAALRDIRSTDSRTAANIKKHLGE